MISDFTVYVHLPPFTNTTVLVLIPYLRTGESFFGHPTCPPFRQTALEPDTLSAPPTPHGLIVIQVLCFSTMYISSITGIAQ